MRTSSPVHGGERRRFGRDVYEDVGREQNQHSTSDADVCFSAEKIEKRERGKRTDFTEEDGFSANVLDGTRLRED